MRKTISFLILFLYTGVSGQEQIPDEYSRFIKKAEAYYQAHDYANSAFTYSSAFKANNWKGTPNDRWNAACSWALANYPDSAFFNLFRLANMAGFTNINRLLTDSDLNSLHKDKRWTALLRTVRRNKDSAEVNFNRPLVQQLDNIFIEDQKQRIVLYDIENNRSISAEEKSKKIKDLFEIIQEKDAINLIKVRAILDKYGWLGPDVVGEQGSSTLFLVIQHSDLRTQEKYLPMMREAVQSGKARGSELALLEDRVALGRGKKQIYGSQITMNNRTGQYMLSPIEDEINVNKRRAEVGLGRIEEYVKHWGITYRMADLNESTSNTGLSIILSLVIVTVLFIFLLFTLHYYKQFDWFWLLLIVCILQYISLGVDYYGSHSQLREFRGGWVLFIAAQVIIEYLLISFSGFLIYKIFKVKHIVIDVLLIFGATLLYSYAINDFVQRIFLPDAFITFFFNILEPIIYSVAFIIINFILYFVAKRKNKI